MPKTRTMPTSTTRLSTPSTQRNTPDTDVPIRPVTECNSELPLTTGPASALTPIDNSRASPKTIVEWPSENQKPTDSGFGSGRSASSLRVALSTAAMWSASKACRSPKV